MEKSGEKRYVVLRVLNMITIIFDLVLTVFMDSVADADPDFTDPYLDFLPIRIWTQEKSPIWIRIPDKRTWIRNTRKKSNRINLFGPTNFLHCLRHVIFFLIVNNHVRCSICMVMFCVVEVGTCAFFRAIMGAQNTKL